jgi:hypothetical protein
VRFLSLFIAFALLALCFACKRRGSGSADTTSGNIEHVDSADPAPGAAQNEHPLTVETNNLNWLTRNSPLIFVGRLSGQNVEKDAKGLIATRNSFEVENIIVGESSEKAVTLTTLGGTLARETLKVPHIPTFTKNQTYVIFTDLKRTVYNPVTGNEQGVFLVVDGAVYTPDGFALIGVEDGTIRLSEVALENFDRRENREKAATLATDPKTDGGIISTERTVEEAGKPMRLEEFSKAIRAAVGR